MQDFSTVIRRELGIPAEQFSHLVYRRYYLVNRLERSMAIINDNSDHVGLCVYVDRLLDDIGGLTFNHPAIQQSMRDIKEHNNLKPLGDLWEDFVSYKYINDQLFVEEFTKEILIASLSLLTIMTQRTVGRYDSFDLAEHFFSFACSCSLVQRVEIIDDIAYLLASARCDDGAIDYSKHHFFQLGKNDGVSYEPDVNTLVHVDTVARRFYHIRRLEKSMELLISLHGKRKHMKDQFLLDATITFKDGQVKECVQKMADRQSLEPLCDLWRDIQRYKNIVDDNLIKEFLFVVVAVYKYITLCCTSENAEAKRSVIEDVVHLYETVESLPLEEILDTIDFIAQELPALLEKYEFSSNLSWRAWFRKYWWAPPIVIATVLVKVALNYKLHHKVMSSPAT